MLMQKVTRFYESMNAQLRKIGFKGEVRKMADYNTYAEYSLSDETLERKKKRVREGLEKINGIKYILPSGIFKAAGQR